MESPVLSGERVVLRPMTALDAERVAEIRALPEVARWWRDRDADYMRGKLADDDLTCWVVELDGAVIGFVGGRLSKSNIGK